MKQLLLFTLFICLPFSVFSQVQGPPPSVGYYVAFKCDEDNDGFAVFNLFEALPFDTFAQGVASSESESNYGEIVYYETEEDMLNEVNPIDNPETYQNLENPQTIYYRANAINSNATFDFLSENDNLIQAVDPPTPNIENTLTMCDDNFNGTNTFDFTESKEGILAGMDPALYSISFFETLNDAESNSNPLNENAYVNTSNPQIVYALVNHRTPTECSEIVELELKVGNACGDLAVFLVPYTAPRPGFNPKYIVEVKNFGPKTIESGSVSFVKDSKLEFKKIDSKSNNTSVTMTSSGFNFNFNDLEPYETSYVRFYLHVPATVNLGTVITNEVNYGISDMYIENNKSSITETVVGSFDPNDILESHGPEIIYNDFTADDYLYYTIRFQNVGTADAINISIDNTLDSKLDKSTIQMLTASHDYVFTRTNNQLNWQFDDIHLPSEDMDEPNSHGYVYYKIKPTAGYSVDDIIPNKAEIYFDFNEPIITNTFQTKFVNETTLSREGFNAKNVSIYPNPTNGNLDLIFNNASEGLIEITAFDIQGKLIFKTNKVLDNNKTHLNVSKLKSGLYILKVKKDGFESVKKLIVE